MYLVEVMRSSDELLSIVNQRDLAHLLIKARSENFFLIQPTPVK